MDSSSFVTDLMNASVSKEEVTTVPQSGKSDIL